MSASDDVFPTEISEDEARDGFKLSDVANPEGDYFQAPKTLPAVVRPIGQHLIAVKIRYPGGEHAYAILDAETEKPVDHRALSLDELRSRYP